MQKLSLPPHALLNGVVAATLWLQPVQTAFLPAGGSIPTGGRQEATLESSQLSPRLNELDALYHSLLKSYDTLAAQWRQRPGDVTAFRLQLAEMRKEITTLCEFSEKAEQKAKPAPVTKGATKESAAPAASGPVRPSQAPSPDEEVRKRSEATHDRFLSVPVGGPKATQTLAGVPKASIQRSCARAQEELKKIGSFLQAAPLDHAAVETSLQELHTIIYKFGSPPSTAPSVHPRGSIEPSASRS